MFDCVFPTRTAVSCKEKEEEENIPVYAKKIFLQRFGNALTMHGTVSLKSGKYAADFGPIEEGCDCSTCKNYTRSYVHLCVTTKDTVGCHLVSIHNLAFQLRLMKQMRESIEKDGFPAWIKQFFHSYFGGDKSKYPVWTINALQSVGVDLLK